MLRSPLPKAHPKFVSLPLLGPIADSFDDWLAFSGFTRGSRKFSIRMLPHVDRNLRRRHIDNIANLNHAVLDACCQALMKRYPGGAGTAHTLERYLVVSSLIMDGREATARPQAPTLSDEYTSYLREVRGFAASTVSSHRRTGQCFLQHLEERSYPVSSIPDQQHRSLHHQGR